MRKKMFKEKLIIFAAFLALAFAVAPFDCNCVSAKNIFQKIRTENTNKNTLYTIDKYQEKYFEIIKRNDILLNFEDDKTLNKDRKELKKLFKKVTKQINSNNKYLKEYNNIEKRYSKCEETTTLGINQFAENNYIEVDDLLNRVYKEVKSKISADDFKQLTASEKEWLKEVNDYKKVFDSLGLGTIGVSTYYGYEIDMREFRTLLLMLYL